MALRESTQWEAFRQARHKFDIAWGQVRLVAPAFLAEHARGTGFALLGFERSAGDLPVSQAQALRQSSPSLDWDHAEAFVAAARKDLGIEPGKQIARLRQTVNHWVIKTSADTDPGTGSM